MVTAKTANSYFVLLGRADGAKKSYFKDNFSVLGTCNVLPTSKRTRAGPAATATGARLPGGVLEGTRRTCDRGDGWVFLRVLIRLRGRVGGTSSRSFRVGRIGLAAASSWAASRGRLETAIFAPSFNPEQEATGPSATDQRHGAGRTGQRGDTVTPPSTSCMVLLLSTRLHGAGLHPTTCNRTSCPHDYC